jgi:hypothetical protein
VRDIYRGIEEREVDRIVLDLPEPWHVVPHAAQALVPGGILLSYLPSTIQVKQMVDRVEEEGGFTPAEVFEVIHRARQGPVRPPSPVDVLPLGVPHRLPEALLRTGTFLRTFLSGYFSSRFPACGP